MPFRTSSILVPSSDALCARARAHVRENPTVVASFATNFGFIYLLFLLSSCS